jgi:hypothetical protein
MEMSDYLRHCPQGSYEDCAMAIFNVLEVGTIAAGRFFEPMTDVDDPTLGAAASELALDVYQTMIDGYCLDILRGTCEALPAIPCTAACPIALEITRLEQIRGQR